MARGCRAAAWGAAARTDVRHTWFRNRVWVGDRANDRVVVFDGRTFEVIGALPAGAGVFHMWADAVGRQLWVVNDVDKTVTVIDANRLEVVETVPLPADLIGIGATPHDVVLDPLGLSAYVSFNGVDAVFDVVVQFDTRTFTEVNRSMVGKNPHVAFSWRTWEVFTPCQNSNAIFVLDGRTMGLHEILYLPGAHGAITSHDAQRFCTSNLPGAGLDAVSCIDTATKEIVAGPADTHFDTPHNVVMTPDGRRLYVTHSGATNDKVSVFRIRRDGALELYDDVTVGRNPFGIAYVRGVPRQADHEKNSRTETDDE